MENVNDRISAQEYLDNNALLELVYIPYEQKVTICDAILSQVLNKDGFATVDSVLLKRVKTQIIIESISNLDLSIVNEDGLNGYDVLSDGEVVLIDLYESELSEVVIDKVELKYFEFSVTLYSPI